MNSNYSLIFKVLLFLLFLSTFSCTPDIYQESINKKESNLKYKKIMFNEVKQLNAETSDFIENKLIKNANLQARTSQFYGKEVDTTNINYLLKEDGTSSFTLRVENEASNLSYIENIVIENKLDNTQNIFLVKYNLNTPVATLNEQSTLDEALISSEVFNFNFEYETFSNIDCLGVGYYTSVDKCEGELVTPGENPNCFNSDGTPATVQIFVVIEVDCGNNSGDAGGDAGDGGFNGNPPDGSNSGNDGVGGNDNGSGIFVPIIFDGDADPNNAGFMFAGQVNAFLDTLPEDLSDLATTYSWVKPYILQYLDFDLSKQNKNHITAVLNNFYNFQLNSYSPNLTVANNERLNFWAFYSFLNNNPLNAKTTKINDIKNFVIDAEYDTANALVDYLYENREEEEAIDFGSWAVGYLEMNPSVTIAQFKNWFMTPREGKDWDYDAEFWENPNLTFPEQDLPSWEDFEDAFPTSSGSELVETVGGQVKQAYDQYPSLSRGYCALKVSRALNYSGITIPQIITTAGKPGTVQGSDGKYYFLNAKALNAWMRETFGTNPENPNHHHFTSQQGGTNGENFPTLVAGLKGIYSMVSTDSNWASGHADIIENQFCLSGCHLSDTTPAPIDYIDIWVLE